MKPTLLAKESTIKNPDAASVAAWVTLIGLAGLLPMGSVWLGYWLLGMSLPTLMSISFLLLLLGSMACWPAADRQGVSSEGVIVLILGQSTGVGVLILLIIRLCKEGVSFAW